MSLIQTFNKFFKNNNIATKEMNYSFNDNTKHTKLNKLNDKQKDLKAFIYSPFVETELARIAKEENDTQKSLAFLLDSLENTRKIKPNDEVKIYYDILNLYDVLGDKNKKDEYILKCKEVKDSVDSLYKKMCDEM